MPIETINLSDIKYKGYINNFYKQRWTLCVGAGICAGILPNWLELTRNLVNKSFNKNWSHEEFSLINKDIGFSLDSWIQGCLNKFISDKKNSDDFYKLLENELYRSLLVHANKKNLGEDLIKIFHKPTAVSKENLYKLCDFFEDNYSETTLMQLVSVFLATDEEHKLPSNIITFNADSLLHALLRIFNIKKESQKKGIFHHPKEKFKKITRTFNHMEGSIPIIHLHGSISPYSNETYSNEDSRDSLIFLENSYNNIAGSMYTWPQTNFLYLAQNTKMVFLGLSMSDSNIRRWLSWTTESLTVELTKKTKVDNIVLPHLWIRTKSSYLDAQDFLDVSLRHLGVKIGLVDSWKDIEKTMRHIM